MVDYKTHLFFIDAVLLNKSEKLYSSGLL